MSAALAQSTRETSPTITPPPTYLFQSVKGSNEHMDYVARIFDQQIVPLYGDQSRALEKISEGRDRRCKLLYENQAPVGILVYKKDPTDEFSNYKIKNSLEIKSLFVIDPEKNSGRGIGTKLIDKITDIARRALADSMHVTVSSQKKTSKDFFQKKGFSIQKVWKDKYMKDSTEFLLQKSLKQSKRKQEKEEIQGPKKKRQRTEIESRGINKAQEVPASQKTSRPIKTHEFPLKAKYIRFIQQGTKTIEGRINTGGFLRVEEGDVIHFFCQSNEVWIKVLEKTVFTTFREMLEKTGVQNCLPGETSVQRGVDLYNSFPGYTRKVARFGVAAMSIKVVEKPKGEASRSSSSSFNRGGRSYSDLSKNRGSSYSYRAGERSHVSHRGGRDTSHDSSNRERAYGSERESRDLMRPYGHKTDRSGY